MLAGRVGAAGLGFRRPCSQPLSRHDELDLLGSACSWVHRCDVGGYQVVTRPFVRLEADGGGYLARCDVLPFGPGAGEVLPKARRQTGSHVVGVLEVVPPCPCIS
jgi:hypothetical protein